MGRAGQGGGERIMGRWWWGRGIKREGKRKSSDGENGNDVDCGGSNLVGSGEGREGRERGGAC